MRFIGSALLFSVVLQAMVRPCEIRTPTLANVSALELDLGQFV